jgi:hypothetical protein
MRKNKAPRPFARVHELGHDGFEIMSVGAQTMEPDYGGDRLCCGFNLNGFQHGG